MRIVPVPVVENLYTAYEHTWWGFPGAEESALKSLLHVRKERFRTHAVNFIVFVQWPHKHSMKETSEARIEVQKIQAESH